MRRRQIWGQAASEPPASAPEIDPAELYERKFGKKPHHRMKRETILRKLQDGDTE